MMKQQDLTLLGLLMIGWFLYKQIITVKRKTMLRNQKDLTIYKLQILILTQTFKYDMILLIVQMYILVLIICQTSNHLIALRVKMNQTLVLITQLSLMLEFGIVNSITLDLDGICNLDKKKKAGKLPAFFLFFYNRYYENLFNYFYCCFLSRMFRVC